LALLRHLGINLSKIMQILRQMNESALFCHLRKERI